MRFLIPAVVFLFTTNVHSLLLADENDLFTSVGKQTTVTITVAVTDDNGNPIAGAEVTPWALRSSQGHGRWSNDGKDRSETNPIAATTDKDGIADISYPFFRDATEKTKTTQVSVHVRRGSFSLPDAVHINVPSDEVFEIKMQPAASIRFRPTVEGVQDVAMEQIQVLRSDIGSWENGYHREIQGDYARVDQLFPGPTDFLLIRMKNGEPTHFSEVIEVELKRGVNESMDVPLYPATSVSGKLADDVTRPVVEGRILAMTVPPESARERATWHTWSHVDADGTFLIESWPRDQSIQIIGLTETHRVRSPKVNQKLNSRVGDPVVFDPPYDTAITLEMEPLYVCRIQVQSLDDQPIGDVKVHAYPNVFWKNWGSQVYGSPLARSADFFGNTNLSAYFHHLRSSPRFPSPFEGLSHDDGSALIKLPAGTWGIYVHGDRYEVPIVLGRRNIQIDVSGNNASAITLRLVPRGTDLLGDYDKLAGIVFGCSTKEGERICALPEVREKMDEFVRQIQQADDPQDPKILSEAFMLVSDAFLKAGYQAEATKWRRKALKMKVKLTQAISNQQTSD